MHVQKRSRVPMFHAYVSHISLNFIMHAFIYSIVNHDQAETFKSMFWESMTLLSIIFYLTLIFNMVCYQTMCSNMLHVY